jgi:hypothetical protein
MRRLSFEMKVDKFDSFDMSGSRNHLIEELVRHRRLAMDENAASRLDFWKAFR